MHQRTAQLALTRPDPQQILERGAPPGALQDGFAGARDARLLIRFAHGHQQNTLNCGTGFALGSNPSERETLPGPLRPGSLHSETYEMTRLKPRRALSSRMKRCGTLRPARETAKFAITGKIRGRGCRK